MTSPTPTPTPSPRSSSSPPTARRPSGPVALRAARAATFVYFGVNGFVMGTWVVHIPAIEQRTGVSHPALGGLLLLLGLGAFAGMQVAGPLADRLGSRRVVPAGALLCSLALIGPGVAGDGVGLALALLALGLGNGALDVSMNTHAVQVEAGYGRAVMSAFHAVYSVGGFAAALVGAITLSGHVSPAVTLPVTAVVAVVVTMLASRALLPHEPGERPATAQDGATAPRARRARTPRRIWWLAALAFAVMLTEGVAGDWSTLAARDGLGASAAAAALAFAAFAGAMTVGRFAADRVVGVVGPVAVVRYGATAAAVGLAVVVASPWIVLTIGGWTVVGLGLSGCVPQLFSAAGHSDPTSSGANVARVAGLGYVGILAGPAVIGPLTSLVAVQHTFVLPLIGCAAVALLAGVAAPAARPE